MRYRLAAFPSLTVPRHVNIRRLVNILALRVRSHRSRLDQTRPDQSDRQTDRQELQSTPVKTTQYKQSRKPVWCRNSASMDVYSIALIATVIWRRRQRNRRLCYVHPTNEGRHEFDVFTHLYLDLLQDGKIANYFRIGFESFKKLTSFVSESVVK
jgi:hypothetical protein